MSGHWINANSQTSDITKMDVTQKGDQITVHAWGKCVPSDCDWGSQTGLATSGSASITWDQSFVLRKWVLNLDAGRLRLKEESVYLDKRPPHQSVEVFVKK
jgi:hypothetical protein